VGLLTRLVVALLPNRGGGSGIQRGRESEARGPARLPGSPPPTRAWRARAREEAAARLGSSEQRWEAEGVRGRAG
jgi:hypothetical protein